MSYVSAYEISFFFFWLKPIESGSVLVNTGGGGGGHDIQGQDKGLGVGREWEREREWEWEEIIWQVVILGVFG